MKKVLVICNLEMGGEEKMGSELILNMDKTDLQVCFLCFGHKQGVFERKVIDDGNRVIHIDSPKFPYLHYYRQLKEVQNKYGPFDVVHSHHLLNNGITLYFFHRLGVPKLISHSHTTDSNRTPNLMTRIYEKEMKKLIKKYATDFLACGQEAGVYLYGKELFNKKGIIINNGINVDQFKFDEDVRNEYRDQFELKDQFVIGNIARLEKVKNHLFLLDVFSEVVKKFPNSKLVIVGDGSYKEKIENRINDLNLNNKVLVLGARSDIAKLQNMLDVIVYPSLYEGLPVSLVEAQQNNLPCVLSNNITTEVKISENVDFLDLDEGLDAWSNAILKYNKGDGSRYINKTNAQAKKYDIKESSKVLRKIYLGDEI